MLLSFEEFLDKIQPVSPPDPLGGNDLDPLADEVAQAISALPHITRESLASTIRNNGKWVPVLSLCVGLTQEQLKNLLRHRFKTPSWNSLAQNRPEELISYLDEHFGLVKAVENQRNKTWSFADVLKERLRWSRSRGVRSTTRGRLLEDAIEQILQQLELPYVMRTKFKGRGQETIPCDFAVPEGGTKAMIVGAAKGFDSTGSKLTDAVREVEKMAQVRNPLQFVFVVVDGIGWLNRQSDLRRLWDLFNEQLIDGLYTMSMLDQFKVDLSKAAQRVGLLS